MPRPVKQRRISALPSVSQYIPYNVPEGVYDENILAVEELEAIRLKDLIGLDQEECAKLMNVSRATFQNILSSARKKVADSLVNGKAIRVKGGNYVRNVCRVMCKECGAMWNETFEDLERIKKEGLICPNCGGHDLECVFQDKFCGDVCCKRKRHRRGQE
ncbi:DUF134 domain-containing protein [Calorimonas adulescens]|uniref:UPF0251 protein FWJ32_11140 n=1 Tax=Calorimonas adulescens TaxID=2606906 RepID=A0A5D8Q9T0_9THEO|nr:DUF134 domain-containing protein [Calorimonas adulescens]TZE80944.1 DUF134 domain-containing protein [Calorimonas adulescens]